MNRNVRVFVDASVFMGMHNTRESIRIACKNLIADQLWNGIAMTFEHIGICDNVVWGFPREVQDKYYPFMDILHTEMTARRVSYTRDDIQRAESDSRLKHLDPINALLLAKVCNEEGLLYTILPGLLNRGDLPVRPVRYGQERRFPAALESTYQLSLALRIEASSPDSKM